jgi:hypothetical protein
MYHFTNHCSRPEVSVSQIKHKHYDTNFQPLGLYQAQKKNKKQNKNKKKNTKQNKTKRQKPITG